MSWFNSDSLLVKFGTEKATAGRGGEYNQLGPQHMIEFSLDLTAISTAVGGTILSDNVFIPSGVRLDKVEVQVTEVTSGTNANLDLGTIAIDRSTEIDYNGLLAATDTFNGAAVGTIETYLQGTTEHGADLGELTTAVGYVTANSDTAAYTAGEVTIRIYYSEPRTAS